jgi:hypothetical protein
MDSGHQSSAARFETRRVNLEGGGNTVFTAIAER